MLNTALLSRMSQKSQHTRYEEIILGRILCEEAPQVVTAWLWLPLMDIVNVYRHTCLSTYAALFLKYWGWRLMQSKDCKCNILQFVILVTFMVAISMFLLQRQTWECPMDFVSCFQQCQWLTSLLCLMFSTMSAKVDQLLFFISTLPSPPSCCGKTVTFKVRATFWKEIVFHQNSLIIFLWNRTPLNS